MTDTRLIETDEFPFEFLSVLGEQESWRKEVHRPVSYLHKWWAKRLGSTFRGIILGSMLPQGGDLEQSFYLTAPRGRLVLFDPFMGSGTTVAEAHKVGCVAIGQDINPIAAEAVRVSLSKLDAVALQRAFTYLSESIGRELTELYETALPNGEPCDLLYYFWVMQATCPICSVIVDLFNSRVFARNAYPDRKPEVQVVCPGCDEVFASQNRGCQVSCEACGRTFNQNSGPARGSTATCVNEHEFKIAEAVRLSGTHPAYRMYAKLVITQHGEKRYLRITDEDREAYSECERRLEIEESTGLIRLPTAVLSDGFNTRQALGYNFREWRHFFNARQLLALGRLQAAIARIERVQVRDALLVLFSGVLEFNNMFASYKGEGTGAVRHMFAHHILKPERVPIEGNPWGHSKSSGSFSTLYRSRLLRALTYRAAPTEIAREKRGEAVVASAPFSGDVDTLTRESDLTRTGAIYLACGSSDATNLADASVDLVVTDPPFFDNVHYSELADFFLAWQTIYPHGFIRSEATSSRHPKEVQDVEAAVFSQKLCDVLTESRRVLRDDGLLAFTYHHSRPEGWTSVAQAIYRSGFYVVNAHPVKAEMSVAMPKMQAREPIQLDTILVCRKAVDRRDNVPTFDHDAAERSAVEKAARLVASGFSLTKNDRLVILTGEVLRALGQTSAPAAEVALNIAMASACTIVDRMPVSRDSENEEMAM